MLSRLPRTTRVFRSHPRNHSSLIVTEEEKSLCGSYRLETEPSQQGRMTSSEPTLGFSAMASLMTAKHDRRPVQHRAKAPKIRKSILLRARVRKSPCFPRSPPRSAGDRCG